MEETAILPDVGVDETPEAAQGEGKDETLVVAGEENTEREEPVEPAEKKPAKTFSQEEVNRILAGDKRRFRAENETLRERLFRLEKVVGGEEDTTAKPQGGEKPRQEDFTDYDTFNEALTDWKVDEKFRSREERQNEAKIAEERDSVNLAYRKRIDEAKERYQDYEAVVLREDLPITPIMADAIMHSDLGAEVSYYLGKNQKEAERIAQLPPLMSVKELGRLEAIIEAKQKTTGREVKKKPTSVVRPGEGSPVPRAKDVASMTNDEFEAYLEKTKRGA